MNPEKKALFDLNFGKSIEISPEAYVYMDQNFKLVHAKARELLVESGSVARYFYITVSGVQALYYINPKGEKVVLGFTFYSNPSGVYESFVRQSPSGLFLEALTDSSLIAMDQKHYEQLFELFPEFLRWRVDFIEMILFGRGRREVELTTMSAKERFDLFFDRCPPQLLTIPQKYLASYLNMKPETLSRLRALRD